MGSVEDKCMQVTTSAMLKASRMVVHLLLVFPMKMVGYWHTWMISPIA